MKNVMICPLNWGMGHATRIKPLASRLKDMGYNVTVAAPDILLTMFDSQTCNHKIRFNSISIAYSARLPQYLLVILQLPFLLIQYLSDLYQTRRLTKKHSIDIIISDNRFGARTRQAWCVYLTHQLSIPSPSGLSFLTKPASWIHRKVASCYNECWVPDIDGFLTSKLSNHNNTLNNIYNIGLLSMLSLHKTRKPDLLPSGAFYTVILSGPEPQRSILQDLLESKLSGDKEQYVFACGIAGEEDVIVKGNLTLYKYVEGPYLRYLIEHSTGIICRAGYSTIMDLVYLGKSALLIPTPGQTEQEYLASSLSKKGMFTSVNQAEINKETKLDIPLGNNNFEKYIADSSRLFTNIVGGLANKASSQ